MRKCTLAITGVLWSPELRRLRRGTFLLAAWQDWCDAYLKDNSWLTTVASLKHASLVSTEEERLLISSVTNKWRRICMWQRWRRISLATHYKWFWNRKTEGQTVLCSFLISGVQHQLYSFMWTIKTRIYSEHLTSDSLIVLLEKLSDYWNSVWLQTVCSSTRLIMESLFQLCEPRSAPYSIFYSLTLKTLVQAFN